MVRVASCDDTPRGNSQSAVKSAGPPAARPQVPDLDGPDDPTRPRRLDWAPLMARTWGLSVPVCPGCAGPMRVVSVLEDPGVMAKILVHLGLPVRAPPRGPPSRARAQAELPLAQPGDAFD